jgi:uncharacterized membrane protein
VVFGAGVGSVVVLHAVNANTATIIRIITVNFFIVTFTFAYLLMEMGPDESRTLRYTTLLRMLGIFPKILRRYTFASKKIGCAKL